MIRVWAEWTVFNIPRIKPGRPINPFNYQSKSIVYSPSSKWAVHRLLSTLKIVSVGMSWTSFSRSKFFNALFCASNMNGLDPISYNSNPSVHQDPKPHNSRHFLSFRPHYLCASNLNALNPSRSKTPFLNAFFFFCRHCTSYHCIWKIHMKPWAGRQHPTTICYLQPYL